MGIINLLTSATLSGNLLPDKLYYILCAIPVVAILFGIHLMSKVNTAHIGNKLNALAIAFGIIITLIIKNIIPVWIIWPSMAVGLSLGLILAKRVKMIQMPELVALLNGIGGASSAIVAMFSFFYIEDGGVIFGKLASSLAIVIGLVTFSGSLVAAGKLHKLLPQRPVLLPDHQIINTGLLTILTLLVGTSLMPKLFPSSVVMVLLPVISAVYGLFFSIRIGGGDMPITISLLNSLSGLAAAIAGLAVNDVLLVAVGGIVGASGLFLTQSMCKAMNRGLTEILLGKTTGTVPIEPVEGGLSENGDKAGKNFNPVEAIKGAKSVIIVPGYGMALAQAQHHVKKLAEKIKSFGASVKYAIHPVAGRMPGHMDVLLIEAGIDYEEIFGMESINDEFGKTDLTIVVGANDVLNPAARNAKGTPIYGMPILNVDQCERILFFNFDLKPGYSGVENPIYNRTKGVVVVQGDASVTIPGIIDQL